MSGDLIRRDCIPSFTGIERYKFFLQEGWVHYPLKDECDAEGNQFWWYALVYKWTELQDGQWFDWYGIPYDVICDITVIVKTPFE